MRFLRYVKRAALPAALALLLFGSCARCRYIETFGRGRLICGGTEPLVCGASRHSKQPDSSDMLIDFFG